MTDDRSHVASPSGRPKQSRSASICAASLEAIPASPEAGRRRRPAARSQSARTAAGGHRRSVRQRVAVATSPGGKGPQQSTSEPRLAEQEPRLGPGGGGTPDVSPNIKRKGSQRRGTSVYHRKSTAFLDVPDGRRQQQQQQDSQEEEDEDSYRLRSFSFTSKGVFTSKTGIVNRGDSFRRRRSRSNSLCPTSMGGTPSPVSDAPDRAGNVASYTVALLGAQGVGKTALISQFMTSECINAYDRQKDLLGAQTVSIMLNGEESELTFQNTGTIKDIVDKIHQIHPPDAFVILYSVVDKASFLKAEGELCRLQDNEQLRTRPAILVGNKIDLARSRAVSTQDGKCLACTYRAKFVEISVGINHNVDELLVGVLTQIRLKVDGFLDGGGGGGGGGGHAPQWYKSRGMVKASMKARQMFTWLFGREDSKFKNCENLHIL